MIARFAFAAAIAIGAASPVRADDATWNLLSAFLNTCAASSRPDSISAVDSLAVKAGFAREAASDDVAFSSWRRGEGARRIGLRVDIHLLPQKREFDCAVDVAAAAVNPADIAIGLKDFIALGAPETLTADAAIPSSIEVVWPLLEEPPSSVCQLSYDKSASGRPVRLIYSRIVAKR